MNRRRINPTRSEGLDGNEWERLLADVRGHLWEHGDFSELAKAANLNVATISRLAHGDTKSPHLQTVYRVMEALGKSKALRVAFHSDKPVSVKQAEDWKARRAKRKAKLKTQVFPHRVGRTGRASQERAATRH